jgi:pyruvate dehydrogenase E2 component (dihydrolipoamide acetyltransferase)
MSHEIRMPHLAEEVDEGVLVTWFVAPGQEVHEGQRIAELQVEKVSSELAAPCGGQVAELRAAPGQVVRFGEILALIDEKAGSRAQLEPSASGPAEAPAPEGRVKASPAARRLARELSVDLSSVSGSGPGGRVVEDDVRAAAGGVRGMPSVAGHPLSPLRRVMAEQLRDWVAATAQFTITAEADVTDLADALRRHRAGSAGAGYLEAVVLACAHALGRHPLLASRLVDDRLVAPERIDIGIAVAVDDGLLVPVLREAATQDLDSLHRQIRHLAARARAGSLEVAEQSGAVFSITNLGAHRVDAFTPLLAPREAAILGLGRARPRPAVVGGEIRPRTMMVLSLTIDHRIIDGEPAAAFLDDLVALIEHPGRAAGGSSERGWLGE